MSVGSHIDESKSSGANARARTARACLCRLVRVQVRVQVGKHVGDEHDGEDTASEVEAVLAVRDRLPHLVGQNHGGAERISSAVVVLGDGPAPAPATITSAPAPAKNVDGATAAYGTVAKGWLWQVVHPHPCDPFAVCCSVCLHLRLAHVVAVSCCESARVISAAHDKYFAVHGDGA